MATRRLTPVAWTEGMLLRPQHLQHHDVFLEDRLRYHLRALDPFHWGIRELVVDEEALVECLRERRFAGAGLDVYEREPALAAGLSGLENVILLPHIGSATHAAREAMGRSAARSIVDVLSGRDPEHRVV